LNYYFLTFSPIRQSAIRFIDIIADKAIDDVALQPLKHYKENEKC